LNFFTEKEKEEERKCVVLLPTSIGFLIHLFQISKMNETRVRLNQQARGFMGSTHSENLQNINKNFLLLACCKGMQTMSPTHFRNNDARDSNTRDL